MDAIGYRCGQLGLIQIAAQKFQSLPQEILATIMPNGVFTDVALRAIAEIPMEWMGVGVVRQGPPYNFEQFLKLAA
jgi:hypothetical protein